MSSSPHVWPKVPSTRKRRTTEAVAIRIRTVRRVLEAGGRFGPDFPPLMSVSWDQGDIGIRMLTNARPLFYGGRPTLDWPSRIEIEIVRWPISGTRWFFRCAKCSRRCDTLYIIEHGGMAYCRVCQGLAYPSTQIWDHRKRTGFMPGLLGRFEKAITQGRPEAARRMMDHVLR